MDRYIIIGFAQVSLHREFYLYFLFYSASLYAAVRTNPAAATASLVTAVRYGAAIPPII